MITQNPDRVHVRNLGVSYAEGGAECSRIHACIAIPAATPTLIERVEPNWAIEQTIDDAAQADEMFSVLMGEDVESRRNFIQQNARDVRFLDI